MDTRYPLKSDAFATPLRLVALLLSVKDPENIADDLKGINRRLVKVFAGVVVLLRKAVCQPGTNDLATVFGLPGGMTSRYISRLAISNDLPNVYFRDTQMASSHFTSLTNNFWCPWLSKFIMRHFY